MTKATNKFSFDDADIQSALVDKLFHYFIEEYDWMKQARDKVEARVDKAYGQGVEEIISATVTRITAEGFEREYQKNIGGFGRDTETTTIAKELEALIESYWAEKVDRQGRASTSYSAITRAEYVFTQAAGDDFMKGFKQELVNSAADIKDGFRQTISAQLDDVLGNVFPVKSNMDKDKNRRK